MMSEGIIGLKVEGQVAFVTINNPPVNIVDTPVLKQFNQIMDDLEKNPQVRALVLSASGDKGFSAGASIEEHLPDVAADMIEIMTSTLEALHSSSLLTVAEVHGLCLGGGAELAFACDFLITTPDAIIGVPEITVGCYPPFAMMQLPNTVGIRLAKEMILSGRTISGDRAYELGLANRVCSTGALRQTSEKLLKPMLKNPPHIVSLALKQMRNIQSLEMTPGHREMGSQFLGDLMNNEDYLEGLNSFLEKRRPEWALDRQGSNIKE